MEELNRFADEDIKPYKVRLFKNKELYDISAKEICDLINKETGNGFNESTYRKWYRAYSEGVDDAEQSFLEGDGRIKGYELKRIELEKEKIKFFDQRTSYTKLIRETARFDLLKDIIIEEVGRLEPYKKNTDYEIYESDNDLLIGLNDIHYGIDIDNNWNKYNSKIAKARLEQYLDKIYSIKQLHKSENCVVCANGDLISGSIHLPIQVANKENIIQQVMGVSELVAWFLQELSGHFKTVKLIVIAGNHSRITNKNDSLKDEKLDILIPWYIKSRLQNIKNVSVLENGIDSTMTLVDIRGLNYAFAHGDYDRVSSISKLVDLLKEPVHGIVLGHLHHNFQDWIQGRKVMMSGSLMGMDDYCIEKRILGKPQQLVGVCTDEGVIATYDINF